MSNAQYSIQSTAGAIPVRNEKGEVSMQKVKVQRYISGKRPEYARYNSSDEESEVEDFIDRRAQRNFANRGDENFDQSRKRDTETSKNDDSYRSDDGADDPRLRRLARRGGSDSDRDSNDEDDLDRERRMRRIRERRIQEPEVIQEDDEIQSDADVASDNDDRTQYTVEIERKRRIELDDSGSDLELSDTEIEKRRQRLKNKMLQQRKDEEVLAKEEEKQSESSESESSSYEEESESEEENEPRLKPLFVSKKDRATIAEKEKEAQRQKQLEYEEKRLAKERRRQTLRMVEDSVKKDIDKAKPDTNEASIDDVCTDDENDEVEYEAWKLRELKRIKRDREEKEQLEKEKTEIDRIRNLTEEERRQEARVNPREVTNRAEKGKYKFLQKYYHRGAFFLDKDDEVFKRDFAQATLEDHFDKTILPKVMQVKNFGRCGRTKYTHLVDQDTTDFNSAWYSETANNSKFHNERAGGMKQTFEKPSASKRKNI
ncbi:microfibrillar-associated protein 1 [Contarinia nasturtii]|uniref:microfibrillar-associated protein 1 n=1 Tax=Contarinia nasturtii TaxID=265458 RepID=UPI0012D40CCE|nr:microfibrillar-associated protein 1 [Contarinia nasturtii]